ncbi:ABC-2 type transport system permease protein [Stackebrandtia endophytica]|uniref:ABC-2 type transport system permease protein n=1 Tax=Stackebrandtia endophytica TaxID=1496996 RepID=A0A543AV54_9ACTN|nr:ABC transporter permease [Stackebrandtia endophytica]TQL76465.1 ABC-2 type transport system permease protein [Stackebrandtia endophytica]
MSVKTSTGAIHNIGYRRYDGPRLGRSEIRKAVYSQTLKGSFGIGRGVSGKLFPWFLVACSLFPALILVIVQSQMPVNPELGPQAIIPLNHYVTFIIMVPMLYLGSQAPQAFSRDIRFKVLPLYFSRQLTATDYVRSRLLGLWTATSAILIAPLVLLYLGGLLISLPFIETTMALLAASVSVLLLTAMITVISALIASVTPRRGLGAAAIIAVLVGSFTVAQFLQAIGHVLGDEQTSVWLGVTSPVSLYDGVQNFLFQGEPFNFTSNLLIPTPSAPAGLTLLLVSIAIVCGGWALLNSRYRKVAAS